MSIRNSQFRLRTQRKTVLFLLALLLFGCTMKGYFVQLKMENAGPARSPVKNLLAKKGYTLTQSTLTQETQKLLERYQRQPPEIEKSWFQRNADYSVHIDVTYYRGDVMSIEIYNVYYGNDSKLKPALIEAASQIEKAIQKALPGVNIIRDEGLTGIPFI